MPGGGDGGLQERGSIKKSRDEEGLTKKEAYEGGGGCLL